MKNSMKKILFKAMNIIPALVLMLAVSSANNACFFFAHQPDVPEELTKK